MLTMSQSDEAKLTNEAREVRLEITKFKTRTGIGHLASALSIVDVLVSLYFDPESIFDSKIDKLFFGKAHGGPAVYPILAKLNFFPSAELDRYCTRDGILRLHPDQTIPGCEFVGGSLGNAIGFAAGVAWANRNINCVVILGDAELYEGSVWESLLFIAHHNLVNLQLIVDRNEMGTIGKTEDLLKLEPLDKKFRSFGFDTVVIDGHNFNQLRSSLNRTSNLPKVTIASTIKGKGISFMEGRYEYHVLIPKSQNDIARALEELS
jgi:transketolase